MSPSTRTVSARTHPNDVCDGSVKKSPLFAFALRLLEKSERYNVTPETSGSLSATTLTASLKTIPDALNSAIVVDSAPAATDASGEDASASAHAAAHAVALARRRRRADGDGRASATRRRDDDDAPRGDDVRGHRAGRERSDQGRERKGPSAGPKTFDVLLAGVIIN
jgi:hypothetical protein